MANFTTVSDLCEDLLFMAGESGAVDQSAWYDRAPELLTAVQTAIVAGGGLADRTLPAIDWWWNRSARRGEIVLLNAINDPPVDSGAFVWNSDTVVLTPGAGTISLTGRMILVSPQMGHIPSVIATSAPVTDFQLDKVWKPASVTTSDWRGVLLDYALPTDFGRFNGSLQHGRPPYRIDVTDTNTLEERFPLGNISAGTPLMAAMVNATTIRMSHYLINGPLVVEFEYSTHSATALARGGTPSIPHHHRRILSYGAAYLLMWEKRDRSRGEVFAMFASAWEAMAQEHYKQTMGPNFGQIIPRPSKMWRGVQRNPRGEVVG